MGLGHAGRSVPLSSDEVVALNTLAAVVLFSQLTLRTVTHFELNASCHLQLSPLFSLARPQTLNHEY